MSSSGLFSEIKKHPWVLALVILVHLGLLILLSINLSDDEKPPMPAAMKHDIIEAVAVDADEYDRREKQKALAAQKKIEDRKAAERKKQKELERKAAEKKAAEAKQRQLEKQKRIALEKKKEQEKAAKALAAKKLAEKKKLERERKEKARLKKERLEKERIAAQKREAERKRKEEERIRKEEEQRRAEEKAEFERALHEEERREEEARKAAARAARLQTQRERYIMLIAQRVESNWLRPVGNIDGQSCDVLVRQTLSGEVIDVQLTECTSDIAFQRSVERAVQKASPLPLPPDPELFDREIYFKFKPRRR